MSEPPTDHETESAPTAYDNEALADTPLDEALAPEHAELERKPFLEHLSDLRLVLVKIAVVFIVCALVCFAARERGLEPGTIELITLGPQDVFGALMTVAFSAAVGLSLPLAVYLVGGFVAPGLTRREKRMLAPGLLAGVLLFVAGVVFAFFVTLPLVMNFLYSLAEGMGWQNRWTVRFYVGFLSRFVLVSGVTFELPLVLAILVRLEVLSIRQLKHYRRHAIIAILVVSAILTPPDAPSMFMVAGPMYLLYEASIVASVLLERRRRRSADSPRSS
jgi:sec-independent protein translocase protein TatC